MRLVAKPGPKVLAAASPADGYAYQTLEPFSKVKGAETLSAPGGHGAQVFDDAKTVVFIAGWVARCGG